jgi:peptidoglycan/LPS O-acetylase OafA/YrhL
MLSFRKSRTVGWIVLGVLIAWKVLTTFVTDWTIIIFSSENARRSINFFLGIAFYYIDRVIVEKEKVPSEKSLQITAKSVLILFLVQEIILVFLFVFKEQQFTDLVNIVNQQTFGIYVGIYTFCCQHSEQIVFRGHLQHKSLLFMNKISYSLFLFHMLPI